MKRRILVIEDETGIRENLREMLEAEGFEIREAETGVDGIRQAVSDPPDLVVCDVMMPGKDGFEVLAELRSRESTGHLPFLFLTARADRGSLRKGMELGAEDYLTKPFSRHELLAAVRTRLDRAESLAATYRRQLGTLRNTLSRALPHEILTPLNGILGLSGILVQEYETMQRNEMLDIARGIADSGESLHRLVRRFLCYSEMEMARLDPALLGRLRDSTCDGAVDILRKASAHLPGLEIEVETSEAPAIVPEHFEVLLRELLPEPESFDRATVKSRESRWVLSLHKTTDGCFALPAVDDGSDLSRAIATAAGSVYDARLERLPSGERILSLPAGNSQNRS
jgi:DNA-binding response OmpR family regulator